MRAVISARRRHAFSLMPPLPRSLYTPVISHVKHAGARQVVAYCVHPILSGRAIENITNSRIDEIVVTDTIPLSQEARDCGRIRQLSVAQMLAETIRRMAEGESVSSLYVD